MAIDIFSIPAMSAVPERIFSGVKHVVTELRNRLHIESIELLECLKSWFKNGIFVDEELHELITSWDEA